MSALIREIARFHNVSTDAMLGKSRASKVVTAQEDACTQLIAEGLSYPQVGVVFGKSASWVRTRVADARERYVREAGEHIGSADAAPPMDALLAEAKRRAARCVA